MMNLLKNTALEEGVTLGRLKTLLLPVLVSLLVGALASALQSSSIRTWYPTLIKSPLSPPNVAFPIAWTILYVMMGLSIGLILLTGTVEKTLMKRIFAVQLFLNFSWCILFFVFKSPVLGLLCILALDFIVAWYIVKAWPINRLASALFVPYLLWLCFATYLNGYIYVYN